MRRRSRLLRVAKWIGTVICVLSTGAVWGNGINVEYVGNTNYVLVLQGAIHWSGSVNPTANKGWTVEGAAASTGWSWSLRHGFLWPMIFQPPGRARWLYIPLWLPFLIVMIPTAFLWLSDRRRPIPGHCRCGYDLTGNVSGTCPECGRNRWGG